MSYILQMPSGLNGTKIRCRRYCLQPILPQHLLQFLGDQLQLKKRKVGGCHRVSLLLKMELSSTLSLVRSSCFCYKVVTTKEIDNSFVLMIKDENIYCVQSYVLMVLTSIPLKLLLFLTISDTAFTIICNGIYMFYYRFLVLFLFYNAFLFIIILHFCVAIAFTELNLLCKFSVYLWQERQSGPF